MSLMFLYVYLRTYKTYYIVSVKFDFSIEYNTLTKQHML
jgi:hypothetical protein